MSAPYLLGVIGDAAKTFENPQFRLLVDHSEFSHDAGTLHGHLMNAYVIAAELLAALKTAKVEMETCRCDGTDFAIAEADKAIAKAEQGA